ncbi:MAG: hypothetical protein M1823_000161 [Watsoniomyces obsoletus]|nr:MAG: hypothetical protein M1823_000161 [Watsoniomyces obsoletus]
MGKAGRFACIAAPLLLSIAALLCMITVVLGGMNKNLAQRNRFYFFKADTSGFNPTPEPSFTKNREADAKLLGELFKSVNTTTKLRDFYTVSLWGYCNGTITDGRHRIDDCSKASGSFYFNPVQVWGLNNTGSTNNVPKTIQDALNAYRVASRWMFTAYIIACISLLVELIVGGFAIFSRWGSFVTALVAVVAALFSLAASALATGIYVTLKGSFDTIFKPYGIRASLGSTLSVSWLAVAFAVVAALFWVFSICCCSGRNNSRTSKTKAEKNAPYNYEPVAGPLGGARQAYNPHGGPGMPMHNMGPAGHPPQQPQGYEPYRHNIV